MTILDEKNTYHIDYGTGAGNFDFTGTLKMQLQKLIEDYVIHNFLLAFS